MKKDLIITNMKSFIPLLCFFLIFLTENSFGQPTSPHPIIPVKSNSSFLFGNDVVLNNVQSENQRQIAIASAFNGWLYASYTYINEIQNKAAMEVLKSTDNGLTWVVLWNDFFPFLDSSEFKSADIIVTGDSISNLKIFIAFVVGYQSSDVGFSDVNRYNGITGALESVMFQHEGCKKIALAHDFNSPAANSNPYSIGVIYSKQTPQAKDSIIFYSSSNGGNFFDTRVDIASSQNYFNNVSLTYGKSASFPSGRYYAAWDEKADLNSKIGHVYTAHSEPNFNSPFTSPVMLDNLDPNILNSVRRPAIACQYNNINNDSSNITEVVICEKYSASESRYDIQGFYNLNSTSSNLFQTFSINSSAHQQQQPSIAFNTFDSTFMVTFYDSTNQKLPFLINDYNLLNPNSWQVLSSGYNDNNNLAAPFPKVGLNVNQKEGMAVWSSEGIGGNGIALFDAPYLPTGIIGFNREYEHNGLVVYPNPCSSILNIMFKSNGSERIRITISDLVGRTIDVITDQLYSNGGYVIQKNVTNFSSGNYILSFENTKGVTSRKVIVLK